MSREVDPITGMRRTEAELAEMRAMGIEEDWTCPSAPPPGPRTVQKHKISAPEVLNEATDYEPQTVSFTRGIRVKIAGATFLFISGTASVDEKGATIHPGDLRAQTWRTYRNITHLLASEGANWHNIVRTTCYLRDIERDYDEFNAVRTAFYRSQGLEPVPASTGIQVRLCRSDLLVEIEAIAVLDPEREV